MRFKYFGCYLNYFGGMTSERPKKIKIETNMDKYRKWFYPKQKKQNDRGMRSEILKQFLLDTPKEVNQYVKLIALGYEKNPKATRYLIYCHLELKRRNDKIRAGHDYQKGIGYFKKQIELTTKIIKK